MRIRIVDAFTDRPFAGNPAAVVVLEDDRFPDEERMRRLAAELNLSETAFVHRLPAGGPAGWALRWFTPATEVSLCGHATLATAHVLRAGGTASGTVRFTTRGGVLVTEAHQDGTVTMDFPLAPLTEVNTPDEVGPAIGAPVLSTRATGEIVGDLLVEVAEEKTVRALAPDLDAVARLSSRRGLIVTAPAESPDRGYDYVSRCFFPALGIPEDPVTGSAHTALAPFWSARLGRADLTGFQASARGGLVGTGVRGDRVLLTGSAVTVIDGELRAAP
jgi:PhzF family phenazine biosynthesis protein